MKESEFLEKLSSITVIAPNAKSVNVDTETALDKRSIKILLIDESGSVPVGDVKYIEYYIHNQGTEKEAIYLVKPQSVEASDDVLAKIIKGL
jgi:hypothetical protein